jgi:hypothetical protein
MTNSSFLLYAAPTLNEGMADVRLSNAFVAIAVAMYLASVSNGGRNERVVLTYALRKSWDDDIASGVTFSGFITPEGPTAVLLSALRMMDLADAEWKLRHLGPS